MLIRTTRLAVAALAVFSIAACGNSSQTADAPPSSAAAPASSAPASSAPASSAPASTEASPTAAESSGDSAGGALPDPCKALTKEEAGKAVGAKFTKAKSSDFTSASKICTYTGASMDVPTVTSQTIKAGADLDAVVDQAKTQFGSKAKVTTVKVAGASDARLISGSVGGQDAFDVIAEKDGIFYQVVVAPMSKKSGFDKKTIDAAEMMLS